MKDRTDYIITEGEFDLNLLMRVIPSELTSEVKFISAGGYSSALSLAKTLLGKTENMNSNIFLVVDADTNETTKIKDKTNFINHYIGYRDHNFKLLLIVPEIEAVLFESKNLFKKVLNREISDLEIELGKVNPRETLKKLNIHNRSTILEYLAKDDIKDISKHSNIKQLVQELKNKYGTRQINSI